MIHDGLILIHGEYFIVDASMCILASDCVSHEPPVVMAPMFETIRDLMLSGF